MSKLRKYKFEKASSKLTLVDSKIISNKKTLGGGGGDRKVPQKGEYSVPKKYLAGL